MRRPSNAFAIALALVAFAGCKCGDEAKKSAPAEGKTPRQPAAKDPDMVRKRAEAMRTLRLAPLTIDEVKPLIPTLADTTPVGQPGLLTNGRQAKAVLCMKSPSTEQAMAALQASLGPLGFTNVKTRPHPQAEGTVTLHAEKQPFRLGATVQKSETPDCPGADGKIKLVLSYFKRVGADPLPMAPAPAPAPIR